jgi:hypothetical protein
MSPSKVLGIGSLNRGRYFLIFFLSGIILISIFNDVRFVAKIEFPINNGQQLTSTKSICDEFENHINGHWKHTTLVKPNNYDYKTSSYQFDYFQEEVDWLYNTSDEWKVGCKTGSYQQDKRGYMYASPVGKQCGCATSTFAPADSKWIWNKTTEYESTHPSFDLVENVAKENKTMCFAGDSIDLQFYTAIVNNLFRTRLFNSLYGNDHMPNVTVDLRQIPVVYSTEITGPVNYAKYWMCMQDIKEALVTIDYNTTVIEKRTTARLRYYKVCKLYSLFTPLGVLLLVPYLFFVSFKPDLQLGTMELSTDGRM